MTSLPPPDSVPMIEAPPPMSEPSPTTTPALDPALDHRGAERAGVVVDEALVHDRRALARCAPSRTRSRVGDPHARGQHVVDHPGELVDAQDLHRPAAAQPHPGRSNPSTEHGPEGGPHDVGQDPEDAVRSSSCGRTSRCDNRCSRRYASGVSSGAASRSMATCRPAARGAADRVEVLRSQASMPWPAGFVRRRSPERRRWKPDVEDGPRCEVLGGQPHSRGPSVGRPSLMAGQPARVRVAFSGMPLARWKDLCLDAGDMSVAAGFWAGSARPRREPPRETVTCLAGDPPERTTGWNQVPEPKVGKNRVHLDLVLPSGWTRWVGGRRHRGARGGAKAGRWHVLAAPDGAELCVFAPGAGTSRRPRRQTRPTSRPSAAWWADVLGATLSPGPEGTARWLRDVPGLPSTSGSSSRCRRSRRSRTAGTGT